MKSVLAIGFLICSVSALEASAQSKTGRARYTPPPAPRYANAAPAPVVTTTTTTVATPATRNIGGYIGTDAFTWSRYGLTKEAKSKSTDETSYSALTSPPTLDFVAFWDRLALRVNKTFLKTTIVSGINAAGAAETSEIEGSSTVGVGFLVTSNIEIGGVLDLNNYSSEKGEGDSKVNVSHSRWGFGPYAVFTIPMDTMSLEIQGFGLLRGGTSDYKIKGVTTKFHDVSGYAVGADASVFYAATNVVDVGAGLGLAITSETDKVPQANPAAAGGTETVEKVNKAAIFTIRLAQVRFKF